MREIANQEITKLESGRIRVKSINTEPSLTQQQFKTECDINNIMRRFAQTGEITHLNRRRGSFQDLSEIGESYQEMLSTVKMAQDAFMELDPKIRDRFKNDPGNLLAFISDEKNKEEAIKLGLIEKTNNTQNQIQNQNNPTNQNQNQNIQNPSQSPPPQNATPNA